MSTQELSWCEITQAQLLCPVTPLFPLSKLRGEKQESGAAFIEEGNPQAEKGETLALSESILFQWAQSLCGLCPDRRRTDRAHLHHAGDPFMSHTYSTAFATMSLEICTEICTFNCTGWPQGKASGFLGCWGLLLWQRAAG